MTSTRVISNVEGENAVAATSALLISNADRPPAVTP